MNNKDKEKLYSKIEKTFLSGEDFSKILTEKEIIFIQEEIPNIIAEYNLEGKFKDFSSAKLVLLGAEKNDDYVNIIGEHLEDTEFFVEVTQELFTMEGITNLLNEFDENELKPLVVEKNITSSNNEDFAKELVSEKALIKFIASKLFSWNTLLLILKTLIKPSVSGKMISFIYDNTKKNRKIAVLLLKEIESNKTIPYLKKGLMDSSKEVRKISADALEERIGAENLKNYLEELQNENKQVLDGLKDLASKISDKINDVFDASKQWLGNSFTGIGKFSNDLFSKVKKSVKFSKK